MSKIRGVGVRKDDTKRLEEESRRMEAKLDMLRKVMDSESSKSNVSAGGSGSRWRSGTAEKPLKRGYVQEVAAAKPPAGAAGRGRPQPQRATGRSSAYPAATEPADVPAEPLGALMGATSTPAAPAGWAPVATAPSTRAAVNLQAAVQQQSSDWLEVESFLTGIGLDRYASLFREQGFDCMDVVMDMEEVHMKELGIASGHVLKLRKRIGELRPKPTQTAPSMASAGASARRVSFGDTEAVKSSVGATSTTEGVSLLDGQFDEEEASRSFKEAVAAWREGRATEAASCNSAASSSPSSRPTSISNKGGSFWSTLGGGEMDLARASTPIQASSVSSGSQEARPGSSAGGTQTSGGVSSGEEKRCCYQCYKQFYAKFAVERDNPLLDGGKKMLCSEACADRWSAAAAIKAEQFRKRQEKVEKIEVVKADLEAAKLREAEAAAPLVLSVAA